MVTVGGPHCGLLPWSDLGGEVFERQLLERLPQYGVHVRVGLPRSRALESVPDGWTVDLLRPGRGLRWYVAPSAFVPYAVRLLRRREVDVLRGHSVLFTGPSLLAARRLSGSRIPVVLQHLHTDRRWERLEAAILRRADVVFTISANSQAQLLRFRVDPGRIRLVYPGIARGPAYTKPWHEAWPRPGELRLLFLSRLVPRKRPEIAIRVLAELTRRRIDASLVVAGEGPLGSAVARLAMELGVERRIRWLGFHADKWSLFDAADVLLFPSEVEGFGFVVAEAQSRGLAVVAAEGTATAELIDHGESGLLVHGDAIAFADAVEPLADPARRREIGTGGSTAAAKWDWDRAAAETAAALHAIAKVHAGGRLD